MREGRNNVLRYALVLASVIGAIFLAVPQVMSQGLGPGVRLCPGEFALCAASICTPTGGMIEVKTATGTAFFREAQCTCPIFPGPSIGDISGGNIAQPLGPGHCFEPPTTVNGVPVDDGIWSLYSPITEIPQEINNWNPGKVKSFAPPNSCPDSTATTMNTFANCFSFACVRSGKIHGNVEVATCFCLIEESLEGGGVTPGTPFTTQAGQGNKDICTQLPVGGPFSLDSN